MYESLQRLAALPEETRIYCGHEYTLDHGRFALTVEPDNDALVRRVEEVKAARDRGEVTLPSTIALERATNPFMRAPSVEEFARRRAAKDNFRG
jgi:hydroxyacylglutathione hydrolase